MWFLELHGTDSECGCYPGFDESGVGTQVKAKVWEEVKFTQPLTFPGNLIRGMSKALKRADHVALEMKDPSLVDFEAFFWQEVRESRSPPWSCGLYPQRCEVEMSSQASSCIFESVGYGAKAWIPKVGGGKQNDVRLMVLKVRSQTPLVQFGYGCRIFIANHRMVELLCCVYCNWDIVLDTQGAAHRVAARFVERVRGAGEWKGGGMIQVVGDVNSFPFIALGQKVDLLGGSLLHERLLKLSPNLTTFFQSAPEFVKQSKVLPETLPWVATYSLGFDLSEPYKEGESLQELVAAAKAKASGGGGGGAGGGGEGGGGGSGKKKRVAGDYPADGLVSPIV
jgi:hypothetical protein